MSTRTDFSNILQFACIYAYCCPLRLLPCWWSFSVSPLWIALQELWTSSVNTPSEVVVKLESWRFRFNGKGLVHMLRMLRIMHMVLTQAGITQAELANCWQIWNDLKWGESPIGLLNFIVMIPVGPMHGMHGGHHHGTSAGYAPHHPPFDGERLGEGSLEPHEKSWHHPVQYVNDNGINIPWYSQFSLLQHEDLLSTSVNSHRLSAGHGAFGPVSAAAAGQMLLMGAYGCGGTHHQTKVFLVL